MSNRSALAFTACVMLALSLQACRTSDAVNLLCRLDADCPAGMICGEEGICIEGCRVNADCPAGEVCVAETSTCSGSPDADADGDADADTDADTDGDTGAPDGCEPPGQIACEEPADCGDGPCTCLDLIQYGGYCYPDCAECATPFQCVQGGCLYIGDFAWSFDLKIIDPEVGGGSYVDVSLELDQVSIDLIYAYALYDTTYHYVWITAYAPIGSDGGYILQFGIDLLAYGEGSFSLTEMNSSVVLYHYDSWESEHPKGLAISTGGNGDVLTITTAGEEVGEHVVGSIAVPLLEYTFDV